MIRPLNHTLAAKRTIDYWGPDYSSEDEVVVAHALLQSLAEIDRLREALTEMEAMYSHVWDRVGGGLTMMPESVARFDEACRKARIALGKPLYGDNGELDEDDRAALPEKGK